jgi:glycosyltransferase involved in cell wall biosynthesis
MIAPTSFFADTGCHVRILEEARVLQDMGNEVEICAYHKGDDVEGLTVHRTLSIPWRRGYEVGSSRHKMAFDVLLSLKSLQVSLQQRFDVIHAHLHEGALIGGVLSRLRRVPLVFDFQGSLTGEMVDHGFLNPKGLIYGPMRRMEELIDRLPAATIVSSDHAQELLRNDFGCDTSRIEVIPDCVNSDSFHPSLRLHPDAGLRQRLGIPPDRRIVVYLGLLVQYQGIGLLLEAMRILADRMPNVHLLLMGWPGVDVYTRRVQELGLADRVTLTGRVPYDEAPRYLALGEVAVNSKISETEGSGKLLNYMAMGLPTAAFDTPVNREYLRDLGVYAPAGDVPALAQAIASLMEGRDRGEDLGQRLRARAVECYSWKWAGGRLMDVYDNVIGQAR